SPAPDTCYAYLVRHGATAASAAHPVVMQGLSMDSPLSEVGQRQANETGTFLAGRRIDAVYASPMVRAQQTAAAIAGPHHLTPTTIDELIEADLGSWEGLSWDDIKRDDAEAYRQFIERPDLFGYGGGESISNVRDRAVPALKDIMRKNLGQVIAVVTHRIVIRACVAHLVGMPLAEARRLSPSTCGLSLIRYHQGEIEVTTFNALFHLSAW
ncbi:MAG TPA: histidine phosphatase family protein, partial [Pirellulales bacterium]